MSTPQPGQVHSAPTWKRGFVWVYGRRGSAQDGVGRGGVERLCHEVFVYPRSLCAPIWGWGDEGSKLSVVGCRGTADGSSGGDGVVQGMAGMGWVRGRGEELRSSHVHVSLQGENLRFGVEVGDGGGSNTSGGYAECRILGSLQGLHVGRSQVRGPCHATVGEYGPDELLVQGGEGFFGVAKGGGSQCFHHV